MAKRRTASVWLGIVIQALSVAAFPAAPIDDTYIRQQDSPLRGMLSRIFGNGQFDKSYALVIGIGDYDAVTKLDAPANDALRVRNFLKDEAGFDYIVTVTDAAANQARIVKLMETTFPNLLKQNDRFLFYFSGHGQTRALPSGPRGYLLLKPSHKDTFDEMIGMPDIHRWAENLGAARHVLFVLDACFSGLAAFQPKAIDSRDVTIQRLSQPSSYLLTAGVDQEESYAYNGASLFTQAFLATARGQINPPPDGIVSLDDMISGINRSLDAKRKQLGPAIKMTPHLYQERIERNEGQFFFLLPESVERTAAMGAIVSAIQGKNAGPVITGPPRARNVRPTPPHPAPVITEPPRARIVRPPPPHPGFRWDARYGHARYYPPKGFAVSVLQDYVQLKLHGAVFYFADGVFYVARGTGFVVVAPPVGLFVPMLPRFYEIVYFGGEPYYYADDTYYDATPGGYLVVAPPPGADQGPMDGGDR